jgi:hypothetical protein
MLEDARKVSSNGLQAGCQPIVVDLNSDCLLAARTLPTGIFKLNDHFGEYFERLLNLGGLCSEMRTPSSLW